MIPILYESTERAFVGNGLGRLRDVTECIVTEERNGIYECDFTIPVTGQNYDLVKIGRIIAVEHDDTSDVQPFDIVSCSRGIDGLVNFHCVHISYRLGKHVAAGKNINSLSAAFTLFRNAQPAMPFTFKTDKSSTGYMACADGIPRTVREMMGGIEGSALDTYGGEYKFDKFNVALMSSRGTARDLIIRYGVDMVDYNEEIDNSETYSSVVPYWSGNDQIVVGNKIQSEYASLSGRDECVPMDMSNKFETAPSVMVLTYAAVAELAKINPALPAQTITVDFVRLSDSPEYEKYKGLYSCQLCDTIKVVFPKYDMSGTFKIVKTTYDVLMERYTELELGTLSTSLAQALGVSNGLGGGSAAQSILDAYPVGSYYETSDSAFRPQDVWDGTWVSETIKDVYVVEEGTTSDWIYRKWSDGTAECWKKISLSSGSFTATGNVYYRSASGYSFPSGLFNAAPAVEVNADMGNVGSASALNITSSSFSMYTLSAVSTARAISFSVYAIGTWKAYSAPATLYRWHRTA